MSYLFLGLIGLTVIASLFAAYPFGKRALIGSLVLIPLIAGALYWEWGGFQLLENYTEQVKKMNEAKAALKHFKSAQDVINMLKSRLKQNPTSVKGWYLLGRLYASQDNWQEASEAFQHALALNPNDEASLVNQIGCLLQLNHGKINEPIRVMMRHVLQLNASQPDVLAIMEKDNRP